VTEPAIAVPSGFTREQLLECVDRELRLRERVYPRWVSLGRMSHSKAEDEKALMGAVRAVLAQLPPTPEMQPGLFPSPSAPLGGRGPRRA